jgi:phospholipase C
LDAKLELAMDGQAPSGSAVLRLTNQDARESLTVLLQDLAYGNGSRRAILTPAGTKAASAGIKLELRRSFGWYDYRIQVETSPRFEQRYAGRIETGKESFSDPYMGRVTG